MKLLERLVGTKSVHDLIVYMALQPNCRLKLMMCVGGCSCFHSDCNGEFATVSNCSVNQFLTHGLNSVFKVQAVLKGGVAEWYGGEWCWMRPRNIKDQKAQRSLAAFDLKVSLVFVSLLSIDQLISRLHFLPLGLIRGFNIQ